MTHVNRKTIRTLISKEQASGQPVTGTDDHEVAVDIVGRLGLHPDQKNKVREIFNRLAGEQNVVLKDAVVTIVPERERRRIAADAEIARRRAEQQKRLAHSKRMRRQQRTKLVQQHRKFAEAYGMPLPV